MISFKWMSQITEVLVTKQSAVMKSILRKSKFWRVDIIHFKTHPETVAKNAAFGPFTGNKTCDTTNLVQLSTLTNASSSW